MTTYQEFLAARTQLTDGDGFDPSWMPDFLFDFQRALVDWAVRQGRAAIFADCGLGKTPMGLVWAENVRMHTGKPVLIVTPLAVAFQIATEADKFGIEAKVSRDGSVTSGITITNYEQLEKFDPELFGGVVCDESSAIKAFDGTRRAIVTEFLRTRPYRLLCTATAAPNDYIELGTASEALGKLGYVDMLNRFFTNKQKTSATNRMAGHSAEWRFKGHAEYPFWQWVASWARAVRRPSDLGYDDDGFVLPPLEYRQHVVVAREPIEGTLFDVPANGLREERAETRRTLDERCKAAAEAASRHAVSIIWCNLNDEGDLLEQLVPNAIQVRGSDSPEFKEAAARWFKGDLCVCELAEFRATRPTEISGYAPLSSRTDGTPDDGHATHQTQNGASGTRRKSGPGRKPTPTSDSPKSSASTASLQATTTPCSTSREEGALSAVQTSATVPAADSLSTTVTTAGQSGGSSAAPATSVSESSTTTLNDSNGQPCICGHASGIRKLISKPVMFGLGLNFQHCSHIVFFPTWSYEQFYQAIRRCWRFGQTRPVLVDVITSEGGVNALNGLHRKSAQADRMFDSLVAHMNDSLTVDRSVTYTQKVELPSWV